MNKFRIILNSITVGLLLSGLLLIGIVSNLDKELWPDQPRVDRSTLPVNIPTWDKEAAKAFPYCESLNKAVKYNARMFKKYGGFKPAFEAGVLKIAVDVIVVNNSGDFERIDFVTADYINRKKIRQIWMVGMCAQRDWAEPGYVSP